MSKIVCFILCLLLLPCAQARVSPAQIAQQIDQYIIQVNKYINIGVKVVDIQSGEVLYVRNSDRTFTPASNQKVLTAVSALQYLGPDYQFKTRVSAANPRIDNGILNGDLVFQFAGDPGFKVHDLDDLVGQLKAKGLSRIAGNVLIDNSSFGSQELGPGWVWNDAKYCFSAPVGGFILNRNCVNIQIAPGMRAGDPIVVNLTDSTRYIHIVNHATTQAANKKGCHVKLTSTKDNTYTLGGCLKQGSKPEGLAVSLENPPQFILQTTKGLLDKHGITVGGTYQLGRPTAALTSIAEHASKPIRSYIKTMLKESDNLISDSLFRKLGSAYFSRQGTWMTGSKAVRNILATKANMGDFSGVIADGSGLSRYNLVSPNQMIKVLTFAYSTPRVATDFLPSLPASGIDGTLKYRLGSAGMQGKVKAKTGTMANVTALSGYIYTKSNRVLAFSIFINGIPGSLSKYIGLEDKICDYLLKNA